MDHTTAKRWLDRAVEALLGLAAGAEEASADLRSSLQGLALVEGMPADDARASMRAAKAIARVDWSDPEALDGQLATLEAELERLERVVAGFTPDERADPEPPTGEGARAAVASIEVPDDPLVHDFAQECDEHLDSAEEAILEIESNPASLEAVDTIFRCFHTIKGGAGLLGLDAVGDLAHAAEFLLDEARKGRITVEGAAAEVCYSVIDTFRALVESIRSGPGMADLPPAYADDLRELERLTGEAVDAESPGDGRPSAAAAEEPPTPTAPAADVVPAGTEATAATGDAATDAPPAGVDGPTRDGPVAPSRRRNAAVKVDTDRLDAMIDLVGELVITNAIVHQEITREIPTHDPRQRVLGQLAKVTHDLQSTSMSMRMTPLRATFQKATRIVRDVARKCGKDVRLVTSGEDTELDRNVVEQIADPLIHMLRNAVDHGIEGAEQRIAAGKPPGGTIRLSAAHRSGSVVITLADDGGGFRRERILEKAVAQGLLSESAARALPDTDVWSLIFHPGLSTASELTDVSGRGVGMDVVRSNIEALRGSISIESTPGEGSTFTVRLPLTLAIIDGMVVRSGGRSLILPMQSIDGFVSPCEGDLRTVKGEGELLLLRGESIPVHDVAPLVRGLDPGDAGDDANASQVLVLAWARGHRLALRIDRIVGQQQVVIKSLPNALARAPFISGAAILGDGTVGLVTDVEGLARAIEGSPVASTPFTAVA